MNKLLRAGIRRYTHNIVFWLTLVVTGVIAVIGANTARAFYFNDAYCMVVFFAFAVMISWMVGRENEEGIFRNKVVSGHTKGQIYISELILGIGACLIMFFLFAGIFIALNSYVFTKVSFVVCVRIFFDALLVNVCFAVILVTLSCLISKRAIIAIVNIILVLAMIFATYAVERIVNQKEYYIEWEYEEQMVTDESGTYSYSAPIEGSEHEVKNPNYIDGPVRTVFETLYRIIPYGHMTEYISLTHAWFGYDYLTWETSDKNFTVTQEDIAGINTNLIWSVIVNGVICVAGYIGFRKKELR